MFVLVKNTSGIEVVINNACSFVDLLWRPKVFVENQLVENLAKYKKNNLVNGKTVAGIIKTIHGEQNRMIFIMHSLIFFSKEAKICDVLERT
jgi:hypothetical protein